MEPSADQIGKHARGSRATEQEVQNLSMPELDYMIIADHVRLEGGLLHMIGGGIDTVTATAAPAARVVGVAVRVQLFESECGSEHNLKIAFDHEDGKRLVSLDGQFSAEYPHAANLPAGWKAPAAFVVNMPLPMPQYGNYSFKLYLDGDWAKTIPVRVIPPPQETANG